MPGKNEKFGFEAKLIEAHRQYAGLQSIKKRVRPFADSLRIIAVYLAIGGIWIFFTDLMLSSFTSDLELVEKIQLCKGWIYVAFSGLAFFFIIRKRMQLYSNAIDKVFEGYSEVSSSYEELVSMENKLYTYAYGDLLTGLPNRTKLTEIAEELIHQAKEDGGKFALLYLDIDNFKNINDTLGHTAGDKLIQYIADILAKDIKQPHFVSRIGGDEFAVLLTDMRGKEQTEEFIRLINSHITTPWAMNGQRYFVSVSTGAVLYPDHGTDLATLMQNADTALFHVKDNNKGGYTFFDAGMREKTLRYIRLHDQIISALQNGEFLLYYQPQIDISSGRISGAEALIRWRKPDEGIVLPMEFIPFAEKTGQITRIGEWVLSEVCRQMDLWKNTLGHDVQVSVNISGADLLHDSLIDFVRKAMADFDIDGHNIILEITETAFLTDLGKALSTLRLLKEMGITIALDDFGTGYSSLTYLQKLPIDILKVDRSFIKNMLESADSSHIFKLIVELAHKLGLKVVAEGVETKEQLDYLTANDCDIVQGFYIGRPVPPDEIETMFRRQSAV